MSEPPASPPSDPAVVGARDPWLRTTQGAIVLGVVLIAAAVVAGVLVGRSIASSAAERDTDAAEHASEQEDAARDRRDLLDARIKYIDQQTKRLQEVSTPAPLLASSTTTQVIKPGAEFSVDGGRYQVFGLRIVDDFESKDERRPAKQRDGSRWALVDVDYTNLTKEEQAPACGTMGTVRLVLDDRTTVEEYSKEPPVAEETYDRCGHNVPPRKHVRWIVPILVPDDVRIAGIHVADVYGRTTGSDFNMVSGKAAWLPFDRTVSASDDVDLTFGKGRS